VRRQVGFEPSLQTDLARQSDIKGLKLMKRHLGLHYALMKTRGMKPLEGRDFERSYGIQILGDEERDEHPT
jgi:hypothetical protein